MSDDARRLIESLGLEPHPEGGWYRRLWADEPDPSTGRARCSVTRYLLESGHRSRWHRLDATEVWFHHLGGSLTLETSADGQQVDRRLLGPDAAAGDQLQVAVAPHTWQAAGCPGRFALVSVMVVPGFVWEGFELAPEGWSPGRGQ